MSRSTLSYYEDDEAEYVEEDWCAFGSDDVTSEDEFDELEDMSHGTDKSPIDVMGFPVAEAFEQQPQGGRRRRRSSGKLSLGQDAEVAGNRQSIDNIRNRNRRTRALPKKSRSLDDGAKSAVAAIARQNPTRSTRGLPRRAQSVSDDKPIRMRRSSTTAGGSRSSSRQEEDESLDDSRQRPSRRPSRASTGGSRRTNVANGSASSDESISTEGRRRRGSNRRANASQNVPASAEEESAEDRALRMKELSNAFKAATILSKGTATTAHLKMDVLM